MSRRLVVTDAPVILLTAYAEGGERIEVPVTARRALDDGGTDGQPD